MVKIGDYKSFIFREGVASIILSLPAHDVQDIWRKTGVSYAHIAKVINKLENNGYVKVTKKGRWKIVEFTEKGRALYLLIREISKITGEFQNLL